jgi:hypothetical protein
LKTGFHKAVCASTPMFKINIFFFLNEVHILITVDLLRYSPAVNYFHAFKKPTPHILFYFRI